MAITYPRWLPASIAAQQEFEPRRVDFQAPSAGSGLGGVQAGFPLWAATWTMGTISRGKSDELRAFHASMRGSMRRFYGYDVARPFPLAAIHGFAGMTRAGGGVFTGAATGWSQAINAAGDAQITLTGLPAGLVLALGDYIGFKWDAGGAPAGSYGRRDLTRVTEGGVTNASGTITVITEPPLDPLVVTPVAIAHLDNPACVMGFVTGETKLGAIDRRLALRNGTLVAVQDRRA